MDSQWLRIQFDLNPQKSKADLARTLGLEPPAISKILNGNRQIKAPEYMAMRAFFGLPVDGQALTAPHTSGYIVKPLSYKDMQETALYDSASATGTSTQDWIIPKTVLHEKTNAPPEQIKIFEVRENTMEPDFTHGEHVLIDTSNKTPSPPGVFVVSDDFNYLLRYCEVVSKAKPTKIRMTANHKMFLPQTLKLEDFDIIGRVIAKLKWL
jgi:transcriptional regulator with XRE-family HTH domain